MEYVNDQSEIEESLEALDRIKDWAYEQMGGLRRPKPMDQQDLDRIPSGDDAAMLDDPTANEGEEFPEDIEMHREDMEMEPPMDRMPPPSFGGSERPPPREPEVIKPRRMSAGPSSQPVPPKDDGMKKWTNDTVNKLDKFGRKLPRR